MKHEFKGQRLYACQFESKQTRQAHLVEKIDRARFLKHKQSTAAMENKVGIMQLAKLLSSQPFDLLLNYLNPMKQNRMRGQ